MLAKRIIPCLDVKGEQVVKGVQFRDHRNIGPILDLAERYQAQGADELVFYDITASSEQRTLEKQWIADIARLLDIPFCVAGGIRTLDDARQILKAGADKISVNSPALENPEFITQLAEEFGQQCVVVGIDSRFEDDDYHVYQYTGSETTTQSAKRRTLDWVVEVAERGAGEIVLNCMNQDGVREGYDVAQLSLVRQQTSIPLIASGGAGLMRHFAEVFNLANVDGALAASVFHDQHFTVPELKTYLIAQGLEIRT